MPLKKEYKKNDQHEIIFKFDIVTAGAEYTMADISKNLTLACLEGKLKIPLIID